MIVGSVASPPNLIQKGAIEHSNRDDQARKIVVVGLKTAAVSGTVAIWSGPGCRRQGVGSSDGLEAGCSHQHSTPGHTVCCFTCTLSTFIMKIYSISILLAPPSGAATVLATASDLSSFSFYQRGSAGEFMTFLSKTVTERTPQGQRQTVQEQSHVAHVYNRGGAEQLAGEYPPRVGRRRLTATLQLSS